MKVLLSKKTSSAPLGTKGGFSRQVPATLSSPVNDKPLLTRSSTQPLPKSNYDNDEGINRDHWASFVDYRLNTTIKQNAQRNRGNKKKLTTPDTSRSKSLTRKRGKMELDHGRQVNKREILIATHEHANGTFVNDEAREINENIQAYESSTMSHSQDISTQDSLGHALGGQEHNGRIRGLELGPCPSQVSGQPSSSPSYRELKNQVNELKSQMNTLMFFVTQNFQGQLPPELAMYQRSQVPDQESRHSTSMADNSPVTSKHEE